MTLASAPNFRDIGGGVTRSGRSVRRGQIFRSEAVLSPTPADIEALDAAGIVLVCDLRGEGERNHHPNRWWMERGVEFVNLDILADIRGSDQAWDILRKDPGPVGGSAIMRSIYRGLPAAAGPHLATIFGRIAAGDVPMLIHCTAGKDRTGFLTAMILTALDVSPEHILADYLASGSRMNDRVVRATEQLVLEKVGGPVSSQGMAAITGVAEAYLAESFAEMTETYGSVQAYLTEAAGLDDATHRKVFDRLLD